MFLALYGTDTVPPSVPAAKQSKTLITRGDIKILEATENIRFLSQEIVKEYLFLFELSQKDEEKQKLNSLLVDLNNNLQIIEKTTKDQDSKDILDFLAYSKDQMSQIFMEKLSKENAALLLDYSETLLEGADSIAEAHMYAFSKEEKMLMLTKKMEYLLERIMKYYIALHIGFDTPTNKTQMQNAISKFHENLHEILMYDYPQSIIATRSELNQKWNTDHIYLSRSKHLFIPELMNMSTGYLEQLITQITLYHTKNL